MTEPRLLTAFNANGFTWNFTLGMAYLLVPLYAHGLGMPGIEIGGLMALPVLLQIWTNLIAGAYADRIGAKITSLAACLFTIAAAMVYAVSASFAGLLAGQFLMILARAAYWPSSWSLASELPGDRSRNMGRLNAVTNAGQIVGLACTGMVIARLGFRAGFWLMAAVAATAFAMAWLIDGRRATPVARSGGIVAGYRPLLGLRGIYLAMSCAYVSALPFSLSASFYPILIVEQGFSSDATGWLLALRAAGSIAAGVFIARFVRHSRDPRAPLLSGLLTAASVGLIALNAEALWIGLFLIGIGIGSGVMTVYFQILISSISTPEQRGSAMALGSLGWGLSHFSTPLIVGIMKDRFGIQAAFYILGAIVLVWALALLPLHRWTFAPRHDRRPQSG